MTKHGVSGDREAEPSPPTTDSTCTAINSLDGEEALEDAR
jgi:hypothetical protein